MSHILSTWGGRGGGGLYPIFYLLEQGYILYSVYLRGTITSQRVEGSMAGSFMQGGGENNMPGRGLRVAAAIWLYTGSY